MAQRLGIPSAPAVAILLDGQVQKVVEGVMDLDELKDIVEATSKSTA